METGFDPIAICLGKNWREVCLTFHHVVGEIGGYCVFDLTIDRNLRRLCLFLSPHGNSEMAESANPTNI